MPRLPVLVSRSFVCGRHPTTTRQLLGNPLHLGIVGLGASVVIMRAHARTHAHARAHTHTYTHQTDGGRSLSLVRLF